MTPLKLHYITVMCHIGKVFISSVGYSSKVTNELISQLNDLPYKGWVVYGYNFVDNGVISKIDLRTDGIYLFKSGKTKLVKNLIILLINFLGGVCLF